VNGQPGGKPAKGRSKPAFDTGDRPNQGFGVDGLAHE
jgi:hypothetical protein